MNICSIKRISVVIVSLCWAQTQALSPDKLNKIGATCYYISGMHKDNQKTPRLLRWLPRVPEKDGFSDLMRKCGDWAYGRLAQGDFPPKVASSASPATLRAALKSTLNAAGAASHFYAGKKGVNNDELSKALSSFFHRFGYTAYHWHTNLAQYNGVFASILDKTDLNKTSHCFALGLAAILGVHLSYKVYKNCIARPISYVGDTFVYQPTKKLCLRSFAHLKEKLFGAKKEEEKDELGKDVKVLKLSHSF